MTLSVRPLLFLLAMALCLPVLAQASGGRAESPESQQIQQRVAAYQICFFKAIPQAMQELGDNTPNEALADKALDQCSAHLNDLRTYLTGLWDNTQWVDTAAKSVRATTREMALEDFAKAEEMFPAAKEQYQLSTQAQ